MENNNAAETILWGREKELELLGQIAKQSETAGTLTLMLGRRRVGKTFLLQNFIKQKKHLYLFVAKKSEKLLCEDFMREIRSVFEVPSYLELHSIRAICDYLLELSTREHFTLVIDEFQEFFNIAPSIFSDLQNLWDQYKHDSKLNFIVAGSVYSLMIKIFEDSKEPLFSRLDYKINLKPLSVSVIAAVLKKQRHLSAENVFHWYTMTNGIARYMQFFIRHNAFTLNDMIDAFFAPGSVLIDEGKTVLIEEFGKDYATYFSILELIASSKTSRTEIQSILEFDVGGFLDRLENDFMIIKRILPMMAKPNSRVIKYQIVDNFLSFWFRFVYKYRSAVEINNFSYLKEIIKRDFQTYSGHFLEKLFRELLEESGQYSKVGSEWNNKGEDEIDIVAINEMDKKILLGDVKINSKKLDLKLLEFKSKELIKKFPNYTVSYRGFSPDNLLEML
jgi:AAA+ ATPase superfamily predicted ATPase